MSATLLPGNTPEEVGPLCIQLVRELVITGRVDAKVPAQPGLEVLERA